MPLLRSEIVVFTKSVDAPIKDWQSLAPYQVTSLRGLGFVVAGSPLESIDVFHYVNTKRAALVGPLTAALQAMTKEGFLTKVYNDVVKRASQ